MRRASSLRPPGASVPKRMKTDWGCRRVDSVPTRALTSRTPFEEHLLRSTRERTITAERDRASEEAPAACRKAPGGANVENWAAVD